jgi:amidase
MMARPTERAICMTAQNFATISTADPITDLSADALSQAIHARQVSCREVMQAYLKRIHLLNPTYNAIINMAPDEALLAQADVCDVELAAGHSRGWMHGMPQAIKDTGSTAGFPTTLGSPLLKGAIAQNDSVMAARMKAAGCIVVGKTNIPEFALGSHTFNTLFGATPNAWDVQVTAGGSSGGAAVALAQRMLPVADGSDFMGSLRNPAGWNHVFGMRPSQGRVPTGPGPDVWVNQLSTDGPMARNVTDLAKLLQVQAGHDTRLPLSLSSPFSAEGLVCDASQLQGMRIGWPAFWRSASKPCSAWKRMEPSSRRCRWVLTQNVCGNVGWLGVGLWRASAWVR